MPANKAFRFGPIALTTTLTTNILNPTTGAGGVNSGSSAAYIILRHVRVVNKTGIAATVSLWLGASISNLAGTELFWQATSCPSNSFLDWYGLLRFDAADFLVGGAGTTLALSIQGEGEIGVAG